VSGAAPDLVLVAACVLVDDAGLVLITKRPEGKPLAGLWEFPGGKVETCETPEHALIRELKEELGIDVAAPGLTPLTFASHAYPAFHLLMPVYLCRYWTGEVVANEGQDLAWVRPEALAAYAMPPADEPLKEILPGLLGLSREL
jgi:8-oxo-dGTP diphosphatase